MQKVDSENVFGNADISDPQQSKRIGGLLELDNELAAYGIDLYQDRLVLSYVDNPLNIPYVGNLGGLKLIEFSITTSTIFTTDLPELNLFPNPASDYISIDYKYEINRIEMYSIYGGGVRETYFSELERIDVSTLGNGVYFMHVITPKGIAIEKIVISN